MNVCVFCSANDLTDKYALPGKELAHLLAVNDHTLVWGGSDTGLMKVMAGGVKDGGGKIIGISMEILKDSARKDADEMIIAKSLGERKALLLERSDAIIMMVGGIGTLDEATEIIELKKHRVHEKPVIILNTEKFYEGLKIQLETMEKEGMLPCPLSELVFFATTPQEVIDYISKQVLN